MDEAHRETEEIIKEIEEELNAIYAEAIDDLEDKIFDYMKRFQKKDETWAAWVEDVKDSDPKEYKKRLSAYQKWREQQLLVGKRWKDMKQTIAEDLQNANESAKAIAAGKAPDVYALNHNYGTYEVEIGSRLNTNYTLYDRNVVARILKDNPEMLPAPGKKTTSAIARGEAIRWNKKQIQSVATQAVLQGESIPKIATRLANEVGDKNRKAAIRNARTMMTGAQNAGRVDSYKRAVDMGIDMKQQWLAVHDMRTRHEHRLLDYQEVVVGEPFIVPGTGEKIMYPGDPNAAPRLIYNCRCTLRGVVAGLEPQARKNRDLSDIGGDYEAWKRSKAVESNSITLPEEKGEAIRRAYIGEYRRKANSIGRTLNEKPLPLDEVKSYEDIISKADKEMAICFNDKGEKIFTASQGKEGSIAFTDIQHQQMKNAIVTHNHPHSSVFSDGDLKVLVDDQIKVLRATGETYTYQLTRIGQGIINPKNFAADYEKAYNENLKSMEKLKSQILKLKDAGNVKEYNRQAKEFNEKLNNLNREWFKENAEKYGYEYEDEKRV